MAGGFTPIPKLQVKDLGTEGTGDRIALLDSDGKVVGYIFKSSLGGNFLPLSGGTMTGDIEFSEDTNKICFDDGYTNRKIEFSDEASVLIETSNLDGYLSNINIGAGFVDIYRISEGKQFNISFQDSSLSLSSTSLDFKGLVGTSFFNKQNDPNAFAQLGDIATINETLTPLSLSDLNTQYPTQGTGFEVICSEINIIYKKSSLTTWKQFPTTDVV